ncbi:6-bladed beta-propeller [Algoriphagus aestuarii]|nr:6-bladed beta-propeller [Algoriphagus aestuarii]
MKKSILFLLLLLSSVFASCSSDDKVSSEEVNNELEIIKIDLSEAREGKLSEFFEPEVDYIWLKDDSEESQLNAGLHKILFYKDKILTLDIFGCKCIKIFDREGNYLSKIRAYGEGPEKYLDLDNFMIVKDEVLLLGLYPPKLMWFSLEGDFLREEKLKQHIGSGVYSEEDLRYYFYSPFIGPEEYFLTSVNKSFQDTMRYFPFDLDGYYGSFPSRNNFIISDEIYLGRPFNDTILKLSEGQFEPKLFLDFGSYKQNVAELKNNKKNLSPPEELEFINKKAKLYFIPHAWFINSSLFHSGFKYEQESYNVFYNRKTGETSVVGRTIENDIDAGYDPFGFIHNFGMDKVGLRIPGKDLYEILEKKKEELGPEAFEQYKTGKGKNLAQAAFLAKDSENPVLIIYTPKK